MLVDLANLEWWQTLFAIGAALGLSPAPWILGLALGRIQFSGPSQAAYDARVADLKTQHVEAIAALAAYHKEVVDGKDARYSELKESRDYYREARLEESGRNTRLTEQLAEAVEVAKLGMHALTSLDEAAKDTPK